MAKGAKTEAPFVVHIKGVMRTYVEFREERENKETLRHCRQRLVADCRWFMEGGK
jgi:hypothetical protein